MPQCPICMSYKPHWPMACSPWFQHESLAILEDMYQSIAFLDMAWHMSSGSVETCILIICHRVHNLTCTFYRASIDILPSSRIRLIWQDELPACWVKGYDSLLKSPCCDESSLHTKDCLLHFLSIFRQTRQSHPSCQPNLINDHC